MKSLWIRASHAVSDLARALTMMAENLGEGDPDALARVATAKLEEVVNIWKGEAERL